MGEMVEPAGQRYHWPEPLSNPMRHPASALFRSTFGGRPRTGASAPGRVNLLGEHTDYSGGPVLPVALQARTTVAVGPAREGLLELVSSRDGEVARIDWRDGRVEGWGAYLAGVVRELAVLGAAPAGGARVAAAGELPVGAGLGSSAALTVAAAKALAALAGPPLTGRQRAGAARHRRDHPPAVRRPVACPGPAQAVRAAALRVPRIVPPPVPVQRPGARPRGRGGEARRCARRAAHGGRLGRCGHCTAGERGGGKGGGRQIGCRSDHQSGSASLRARADDHSRAALRRRAARAGLRIADPQLPLNGPGGETSERDRACLRYPCGPSAWGSSS